MTLDHVTYAFSDLARAARMFSGIGLRPDYGGTHSNGVTHMASLAFDDGTYVELISTIAPGRTSPVWSRHIAADGGACAWAVAVESIDAEAERLRQLGIAVSGPTPWRRERPDGVTLEWKLAFLGGHEPGALLPFLIEDITDRALRVQTTSCVAARDGDGALKSGRLTGVASVVIAVASLTPASDLFHRTFGWSPSQRGSSARLGADILSLAHAPVVLAQPADPSGWLAQRLARLGESPCACLVGAPDLATSAARFPIAGAEPWLDRSVAWIDPTHVMGAMLGVVGAPAGPGGEVL